MGNMKRRGGRRRRWVYWFLVTVGVLTFLSLSVAAIWWVPGVFVDAAQGEKPTPALSPAERVKEVTNARQGVLFVVGGLIAVFTLLITLARHNLDRDANWTTRYTEAIKQLGDGSFAIQLGGIYALERIADDSERDRQTILDVLCSYLRAESPFKNADAIDAGEMKNNVAAVATAAGRITQISRPTKQTVLTRVNLTAANLKGANLNGANLEGANLNGANLEGANLIYANLTGANLDGANLNGANLEGANLTDANLKGANLIDARLDDSTLIDANLTGAKLVRTKFIHAYLTGANLTDANLQGANLKQAHLEYAHLIDARGEKKYVTEKYLQNRHVKGLSTVQGLPTGETADNP